MRDFRFINEEFFATEVTHDQTDFLLSQGWRHFGEHFFRYNIGFCDLDLRPVYALRIDLGRFSHSKSHRRNLRRNQDLTTVFRPIELTPETHRLFDKHRTRFTFNVPESLSVFLSADPARIPCEGYECAVYRGGDLVAVSFFDIGRTATSSIYAMFDPDESQRGLGIFTILKEIQFAESRGMRHYYHGYIFEGESFYDYKKRFSALEIFDWNGRWLKYSGG